MFVYESCHIFHVCFYKKRKYTLGYNVLSSCNTVASLYTLYTIFNIILIIFIACMDKVYVCICKYNFPQS